MLRRPGSRYESGRSSTLLKAKSFHDAEARVIEHQGGAGRHKGRHGALLVQLDDCTQFDVDMDFSCAARVNPGLSQITSMSQLSVTDPNSVSVTAIVCQPFVFIFSFVKVWTPASATVNV